MRGQEDRRATRARLPNHGQELALHKRIQPVGGLIEDEQLGVEEEREQERDLAPIAAREVPQVTVQVEPESLGELVAAGRIEATPQVSETGGQLHCGKSVGQPQFAGNVGQPAPHRHPVAGRVEAEGANPALSGQ